MTDATEPRWFLSTAPATSGERLIAIAVVAASFAAFVVTVPHVRVPLAKIPPFIPAYQSALFLVDLITAVLLLGQFARLRSRAVLVLAAGYLFDAAMIVPHTLSFPGVFTPAGLLGAGEQTTAWLYVFWHGSFPLFVLGYAYYRGHPGDHMGGNPGLAIFGAFVAVAALAALLTLLATAGQDLLPRVMHNGDYSMLVSKGVSPTVWLLTLVALLAVWRRNRSVLDLWLMVVLTIWLLDIALAAIFGSSRFDLGFYAGRIYGLIAASIVLIALLVEMIRLYARLTDALRVSEEQNLELISTREAAARAQRMDAIDQITRGMAHDFNNLFTVICGNLELIGKAPDDSARVERLAGNALAAARRGAKLTRKLLTIGGGLSVRAAAVDPTRLIHDLEPLFYRAAEGMQVMTGLSPTIDSIHVDAAQFEAALVNLITNARDAGAGRVIIETRNVALDATQLKSTPEAKPGAYVLVAVRDTGPGMPAEVAARAFEPFFSTKKDGKVSGLGLAQVFGFVRGAGGHVRLDSQPGRGTSVNMYFPKSAASDALETMAGSPPPASPGHDTILVVEDDPDVRDVTVATIADLGYTVRQAANAEEALKLLQDGAPVRLLFSDVAMPGMNGIHLAAEARRLRPDLKVLLTSGHPGSILSPQTEISGLDVLIKPYLQQELATRLRRAIGG